MLDRITYTQQSDKIIIKTTTHTEIVKDVPAELAAIQAQLNSFQVGRSSVPATQADIDQTITGYQDALVVLTAAAADVSSEL